MFLLRYYPIVPVPETPPNLHTAHNRKDRSSHYPFFLGVSILKICHIQSKIALNVAKYIKLYKTYEINFDDLKISNFVDLNELCKGKHCVSILNVGPIWKTISSMHCSLLHSQH